MSDVDDELLAALAETSSEDERSVAPSSRKSKGRASANSRSAMKRKRGGLENNSEDDESEDEDAQGSDDDDGERFTLDGIYKDEEDRERLLDMTEIDREEELARRRDIISARSSKAQLAALVRSQKKAAAHSSTRRRGAAAASSDSDDDDGEYGGKSSAAAAAKGRKRKAVGASETKSAKLAELRQRRKDKAAGVAARPGGDSDDGRRSKKKRRGRASDSEDGADDSESAYSEEDSYVAPSKAGAATAKKFKTSTEPPTLEVMNSVKLSRLQVEKIIYRPKWEDVLVGSFIRLSWGSRKDERGRSEQYYRIHEVLATHRGKRYYDLGNGTYTCVSLVVAVGDERSEMPMSHISNEPFTERERERWISISQASAGRDRRGERKKAPFPRPESLAHKKETTDEYLATPLTEKDVHAMIQGKKEARRAHEERHTNAQSGRPHAERERTTTTSASHATPARAAPSQATPTASERSMAEMNARNRREDRERLLEADRKAAQIKRIALGFGVVQSSSAPGTPGTKTPAAVPLPQQQQQAPPLEAVAQASTVAPSVLQDIEVDLGAF